MTVTVIVSGISKAIRLESLRDEFHSIFGSIELGSFMVRDLGVKNGKRLIALDFENGFDAMTVQDMLDDREHRLSSSGKVCFLQARVQNSDTKLNSNQNTSMEIVSSSSSYLRCSYNMELSQNIVQKANYSLDNKIQLLEKQSKAIMAERKLLKEKKKLQTEYLKLVLSSDEKDKKGQKKKKKKKKDSKKSKKAKSTTGDDFDIEPLSKHSNCTDSDEGLASSSEDDGPRFLKECRTKSPQCRSPDERKIRSKDDIMKSARNRSESPEEIRTSPAKHINRLAEKRRLKTPSSASQSSDEHRMKSTSRSSRSPVKGKTKRRKHSMSSSPEDRRMRSPKHRLHYPSDLRMKSGRSRSPDERRMRTAKNRSQTPDDHRMESAKHRSRLSPDPTYDKYRSRLSPDPTHDKYRSRLSPDPTYDKYRSRLSPDPTYDKYRSRLSPDPTYDKYRSRLSPDPTYDKYRSRLSPDPTYDKYRSRFPEDRRMKSGKYRSRSPDEHRIRSKNWFRSSEGFESNNFGQRATSDLRYRLSRQGPPHDYNMYKSPRDSFRTYDGWKPRREGYKRPSMPLYSAYRHERAYKHYDKSSDDDLTETTQHGWNNHSDRDIKSSRTDYSEREYYMHRQYDRSPNPKREYDRNVDIARKQVLLELEQIAKKDLANSTLSTERKQYVMKTIVDIVANRFNALCKDFEDNKSAIELVDYYKTSIEDDKKTLRKLIEGCTSLVEETPEVAIKEDVIDENECEVTASQGSPLKHNFEFLGTLDHVLKDVEIDEFLVDLTQDDNNEVITNEAVKTESQADNKTEKKIVPDTFTFATPIKILMRRMKKILEEAEKNTKYLYQITKVVIRDRLTEIMKGQEYTRACQIVVKYREKYNEKEDEEFIKQIVEDIKAGKYELLTMQLEIKTNI